MCSAATCVDVCVACSRTLGRVHVVHFVSIAVSYFVFGEGSLCRAALWCPMQVVVVRRAVSLLEYPNVHWKTCFFCEQEQLENV